MTRLSLLASATLTAAAAAQTVPCPENDLLWAFATNDLQGIGSLTHDGNTLVATQGSRELTRSVYFFDISTPESPVLIADMPLTLNDSFFKDCAIQGDTLYLANDDSLVLVDITDPANPVFLSETDTLNGANEIAVSGDTVAISRRHGFNPSTSLSIIDLSGPTPVVELVSSTFAGADIRDLILDGDTLYISDENTGLRVLDIADPANPAVIGNLPFTLSRGMEIDGDRIYLVAGAVGAARLHSVDITDPANPVSAGSAPTLAADTLGQDGSNILLGSGTSADVTNPDQPVINGIFPIAGQEGIAINGNVGYLADDNGYLNAIDLTDKTFPQDSTLVPFDGTLEQIAIGSDGLGGTIAAFSAKDYGPGNEDGILVARLDAPDSFTDRTLVPVFPSGLPRISDSGIVACRVILTESDQWVYFDASDPANPTAPTLLPDLADESATWSGTTLYRYYDQRNIDGGGEFIYRDDFTDPQNPTQFTPLIVPDDQHVLGMVRHHDALYAYTDDDELMVYDLASPATLPVARIDFPYILGRPIRNQGNPVIHNDLLYFGQDQIVHIYDVSSPLAPTLVGSPQPGYFAGGFLEGDRYYSNASPLVTTFELDGLGGIQLINNALIDEATAAHLAINDGHAYKIDTNSDVRIVELNDDCGQPDPCPPDVNNDGVLDNGDIGSFVTLFLAGDPAADFTGDGILDNGDIGAFVGAFLAGC